jgi:simple sugar transport system substrate-binding protein
VIDGRWSSQPVWGGMQDGLVQLSAVQAALPADVKAGLQQRQQAIMAGRLLPFAAPLVDNGGRTRLASGALDDAAIARMDWLVQGVAGSIPAR